MLSLKSLLVGLLLAVPVISGPVKLPTQLGPLKLFKQITKTPAKWTSQGPVKNDPNVNIQIGLKQSNIDGLQEKLVDISEPSSPNYGRWLSQDEIDSYVKPSDLSVAMVKTWLDLFGIQNIQQPTSDWISFTAPISQVEALLDTKYKLFSHPDVGTIPRTKQYSVPLLLHDLIEVITPTTTAFYHNLEPHSKGPVEAATSQNVTAPACAQTGITPACIKALYDVNHTNSGSQTIATTEFEGVAASHSDFHLFAKNYTTTGLTDFKDISIANGSNPGAGTEDIPLEGNLDTQYAAALAYPNPSEYVSFGPYYDPNDPFEVYTIFADGLANFATWAASVPSPPSVISTSYVADEQYFDEAYLTRACNEFMKAGARGVSLLFASGVGGVGGDGCQAGFYPMWPAACPWSTSVGPTQFSGSTEEVAQFAFSYGSSGGGFSNVFPRPTYQDSQVAGYLSALGSEYQGMYNASGRGYPDLSLVAVDFQVVINGAVEGIYGTSAASPSVAGLVSTLNDFRVKSGKPVLGFLNPLLYAFETKGVFNDIVTGSNPGCAQAGFPALEGWDPATGMGSSNYAKLRALL